MLRSIRLQESQPTVSYEEEIVVEATGMDSADVAKSLMSMEKLFDRQELRIAHLENRQLEREEQQNARIEQQERRIESNQKRSLPRGTQP